MKKICGIIKRLTLQELPALLQIVAHRADWNQTNKQKNFMGIQD